MSKQQNQAARIETLEKLQADHTKRIDALLTIIEGLTDRITRLEKAPAVKDVPRETYQAAFDRWPATR